MIGKIEKTDFRNYINPQPKGRFTTKWQQEPMSGGDFYVEDKSGRVFDALLRSIRPGTVVRVRRVFCLAPWRATPRKRRATIVDRVTAVRVRAGVVLEAESGLRSDKPGWDKAMMAAYDDVATSGRGQAKRERSGRPAQEWTPHELQVMETVWQSRRYKNDDERLTAIRKRIGRTPGRTTLRNRFGSPHKVGDKD